MILDLKVTDQGGVTYNIELQREDRASILSRALFQYSRITGEQLHKNDGFDDITPVVIVLLCKYSTYPDHEAIRVFQLAPFKLTEARGQQTLPYLQAHFDSKNPIGYHHLKDRVQRARIQRAADSLNLLQIYLVELTKDLKELSPNQQTCLSYLTTDFLFTKGETDMNGESKQGKPKVPQYFVHEEASESVKKWIKEAQERLEYFAGQPDQRQAHEHELMNVLDHNTAMNHHFKAGLAEGKAEGLVEGKAEGKAEGRAELLPMLIQSLKTNGMNESDIISTLQLTLEEQDIFLK